MTPLAATSLLLAILSSCAQEDGLSTQEPSPSQGWPDIQLAPPSIDFGQVEVDGPVVEEQVLICNQRDNLRTIW